MRVTDRERERKKKWGKKEGNVVGRRANREKCRS